MANEVGCDLHLAEKHENEGIPKAEIDMMRENGLDPEEVAVRHFEEAHEMSTKSAFEIRTHDAVKFAIKCKFRHVTALNGCGEHQEALDFIGAVERDQ